jgi:penicillin-insensitive murein DD-endopeptidase
VRAGTPLAGRLNSALAAAFCLWAAFDPLSSALRAEATVPAPDTREAKKAFGAIKTAPANSTPQAIGQYDRGCVSGAQNLPSDGPGWQLMRLSRNRFWGHPVLISYIRKLAADTKALDGWPGLLVGDMAQPIGGPLLGGHASHQIGLDVDLWYMPAPGRTLTGVEREQLAAVSMVDNQSLTVSKKDWTGLQVKLLKRAASYAGVARIFVHPAIKKALCDTAGQDREWLQKIRPWYQHHDHFHIRLNCPPGNAACNAQAPLPTGDGCGQELDGWFKKLREPPKKPGKPPIPPKPMLVSELPEQCRTLLAAAEIEEGNKAAAPGH